MKKASSLANIVLKLLIIIFLFESCTIYRARNAGIDKAVELGYKVKLETKDNQVYKFRRLGRDENGLYGLAGITSKTAKRLAEDIVDENMKGRFVKIGIDENSVEEVRVKNKMVSFIVPLVITFVALFGFLGFVYSQIGVAMP